MPRGAGALTFAGEAEENTEVAGGGWHSLAPRLGWHRAVPPHREAGFGFWEPLGMGWLTGGSLHGAAQWVPPCEIPLVPKEMPARSGRGRRGN